MNVVIWWKKIYLTYICICGRSEGGDPKWGSPHSSRKNCLLLLTNEISFHFSKKSIKIFGKKRKRNAIVKIYAGPHMCLYLHWCKLQSSNFEKKYLVMVCDIVIRFFYKSTQQWYLLPPIYIKNLTTIFRCLDFRESVVKRLAWNCFILWYGLDIIE